MALAFALLDFFLRVVCTVVVVFVVPATFLAVFTEDFVAAEVGGGSFAALVLDRVCMVLLDGGWCAAADDGGVIDRLGYCYCCCSWYCIVVYENGKWSLG
mmetsp:Transcript_25424/g.37458  ORF Transcript_25424/g.37458 Transcript_25424/m.37458 type:complete len:100 (+) Transcript_25424:730-1029(+)